MYKKLFFALALLLSVNLCNAREEELQLTLSLKKSFKLNEPIMIKIRLTNLSSNNIKLSEMDAAKNSLDYELRTPQGYTLTYIGPVAFTWPEVVELKKGEAIELERNLKDIPLGRKDIDEFQDYLATPGKYSLSCIYNSWGSQHAEGRWEGKIKSNIVDFEIESKEDVAPEVSSGKKVEEFHHLLKEKKAQGYDTQEAEELDRESREAAIQGDKERALSLLEQAIRVLKESKGEVRGKKTYQCEATVDINVDYMDEKGEIELLYGVAGAETEEGWQILKDVGFTAVEVGKGNIFPKSGNLNADPADPSEYDFKKLDWYIQSALEYGFEPIVGIHCQLIKTLENEKVIGPVGTHKQYYEVIRHIVMHLTKGWANGHHFKIKYWRFWNEPETDLPGCGWGGTPEEFYKLYATWAKAIKSVDKNFVVGGINPASIDPPLVIGLFEYCKKHNVPFDYYSWQHYSEIPYHAYKKALKVQDILAKYPISPLYGTPLSVSLEWLIELAGTIAKRYHQAFDTAHIASHDIATLIHFLNGDVKICNRFGGLSMVPILGPEIAKFEDATIVYPDGTPKPVYYAFKGFAMMKKTPIRISCTGTDKLGFATLAGRSKDGKAVTIIIANFNPHLYFKEYPFSPPQDAPSREAPPQVREVIEEAKRGYNYTKYNLE
ncbi:MAG: hypothetical protein AB1567_04380, partial [bacterium]